MNQFFLPFFMCFTLFLIPFLKGQNDWEGYEHLSTPVKTYVVYQTSSPLIIDGKASETDWQKAPWTADFEDIEGARKPKPLNRTRVKMLYDATGLYVLAELEEPHVWATYDKYDMIIYHENDFEVFIDPDGDTHQYFEYELNALNTLLDLKMSMPYRNGGKADLGWNSKGFHSAVYIDGTLNDPKDKDKLWTVEMKIPFSDLQVKFPDDGQLWKVNFSRVAWQIQAVDGKYQKVKDPATGRAFPEYNWVWSPPGLINMHYPERWGMIRFSDQQAGKEAQDFNMPEEEAVGRYLWLVYYIQQDFKKKNSHYAGSLIELGVPEDLNGLKVHLTATDKQFTVQTLLKDGSVLSIDETGLFQKNKK